MNQAAAYLKALLEALSKIDLEKVEQAIAWLREAREQGRQVFVC